MSPTGPDPPGPEAVAAGDVGGSDEEFEHLLQSQLYAAQAALAAEHEAAQRALAASHERTMGIVAQRLQHMRLRWVQLEADKHSNNGNAERSSVVSFELGNGAANNSNIEENPAGDHSVDVESFAAVADTSLANPGHIHVGVGGCASPLSQLKPDDGLSEQGSSTFGNEDDADSGDSAIFAIATPVVRVSHSGLPRTAVGKSSRHSNTSSGKLTRFGNSIGSAEQEMGVSSSREGSHKTKYSALMKRYTVEAAEVDDGPIPQFQVLPVWNFRSSAALTFGTSRRYRSQSTRNFAMESSVDSFGVRGRMGQGSREMNKAFRLRMKRLTMSPNSMVRAMWDFMSLLLVSYDMVMIPLQQFDPPENLFTDVMVWVTRLFWTFDIPMSMITGFITREGGVELRMRKIVMRYLHTWFPLDITIVALDWIEILLDSVQGFEALRMGKASRIFRIIRMVRLLRLVRIQQIVTIITERICSERLIIVADILKIMVLIVGIAHVLGCMWYGIGSVEAEDATWVVSHNYNNSSLALRYTMSLHWSLSQFTGGMDEVTPHNAIERIYTIVVFIFGFITASLFLGSLTSSMTQLQIIGTNQSQQVAILRKYLRQNLITNKLALRVQRNAKHVLQEQQRFMPESSVELLTLVSEPLRVEIHFEMYSVVFAKHPFFAHYIEACPQVMRKVCHEAMSSLPVSRGDIIFNAGEIPSHPKMYFIGKGDFKYTSLYGDEVIITEGSWLAEATLWTSWMHRGMLVATGDCRVFVLDAKSFQRIVTEFDHPDFDPLLYAKDFVAALNRCGGEVSDIHITRYEDERRPSADGFTSVAKFFAGRTRRSHSSDAGFDVNNTDESAESRDSTLDRRSFRSRSRSNTSIILASSRTSERT